MEKFNVFLLAVCFIAVFEVSEGQVVGNHWIPTWGNMPQLTEPANLPSPPFVGLINSRIYIFKPNLL